MRAGSVRAALLLVVVYVLLAWGLGTVLSDLVGDDQPAAQFALGHLVPLPIGIALLLLYVRRAGLGSAVWRERPTPTLVPPRRWLIAIPVIAIVEPLVELADVPWADVALGLVAVVALGTLLVGLGEELLIRGVLLTAVRRRHGELVTLLVTAGVFALAHLPGSITAGAPPAVLAIQVGGLAVVGAGYYWIRRVTGRLWVAALVHAFTDWVLYLGSGADVPATSVPQEHTSSSDPFIATIEVVLWILLAVGVVSLIREDRRNRRGTPLSESVAR